MFERLSRLADGHARRVCLIAVAFFIVAAALGSGVADRLGPYGADDPATESVKTDDLLDAAGYRQAQVIVLAHDMPVAKRSGRARLAALERRIRRMPEVTGVSGYLQTGSKAFVSRDGDDTYLAVELRPTGDKQLQQAGTRVSDRLADRPDLLVGGFAVSNQEVNDHVENDLRTAEMIAFPLLFLLSLLFFRGFVAALLPLMIGGLAIVGTFLALRIATEIGSVSLYALNLTTGLGLGLAIDYSLFIVSRYREEIAVSGPGLAAMRRTLATAGRSVLFSSLTVAVSLASMLIFPQRFLYSMGLGGAIVSLLAALVALTVLPAVLTLLGTRVDALSPRFLRRRAGRDARTAEAGFWYRLSRFVMRRPIPIATICAVGLIVLGLPFLRIQFTSPDARILPPDSPSHRVQNQLDANFPPYHDIPIEVAVEGGEPGAAASVHRRLARMPELGSVTPPRRLGPGLRLIEAIPRGPYTSEVSRDAVERIRDLPPPPGAEIGVSGYTAHFIDFQHSLTGHLPYALAIIVIATLAILFLMTGSVILPIKSLLMNVLNLSAIFGILVLIFQDGHLGGLLDFHSQGAIDQSMPVLLIAVVFGLSTDYAVFLLSRIKEAHDAGHPSSESVALGLERTGRIVTAAALLFAIAVGAFSISSIVFIKELGIGTALAVLIDATVIRALLVPSLMELLGDWNWWAPRPLRRVHERWGLEENVTPAAPATGGGGRSRA